MAYIEKRIEKLETLTASETETGTGGLENFAELLRQARKRAGTGRPIPQTRITQQMLDDPIDGKLYRQILEARERVRNLRLLSTADP
jgi:hypothetical protein